MRLVLDTNVWLDWLVFDDPGAAPARTALQCQVIDIVIDDDCAQELQRVLAYSVLALDAHQQADCLCRLREYSTRFSGPASPLCANLPKCRDRDDQKFLELACNAGADWLITRDKALLAVSRHKTAMAGFGVATPAQFSESLAAIKQQSA